MMKKLDLSQLDPLYDKKLKCIFCQQDFTSKRVRSRFVKPIRVESDFGPVFKKEEQNNPLYYYVTVCPHCGLSFSEDFGKRIGKAAKNAILEEITKKIDKSVNYSYVRDFDTAVRAFKLAIYSAELLNEKHMVFANLCLRLAWLYRGEGMNNEEVRFLHLAALEFEQSYLNTDFNPETTPEMQVLYLVGELYRKLGKYQEAVKYFSSVVDHPDRSRYMKYVNLARDQWKLAAEEYREVKR